MLSVEVRWTQEEVKTGGQAAVISLNKQTQESTWNSNACQHVKWNSVMSPNHSFTFIWIRQRDANVLCVSDWGPWLKYTMMKVKWLCCWYVMSSINRELTLQTFTVNTRWFLCFHFDRGSLTLAENACPLVDRGPICSIWGGGKKEKYYLASNQMKSSKCRGSIQICVLLHCFVACNSYWTATEELNRDFLISVVFNKVKGAVCSFGEEMLVRTERSSVADYFFCPTN